MWSQDDAACGDATRIRRRFNVEIFSGGHHSGFNFKTLEFKRAQAGGAGCDVY